VTNSRQEFDLALSLIQELSQALSQADTCASELNRRLIQRASDFLEKHGRNTPSFD
jgi:hypothetical protein